jgi:hypothetical protein
VRDHFDQVPSSTQVSGVLGPTIEQHRQPMSYPRARPFSNPFRAHVLPLLLTAHTLREATGFAPCTPALLSLVLFLLLLADTSFCLRSAFLHMDLEIMKLYLIHSINESPWLHRWVIPGIVTRGVQVVLGCAALGAALI